jgi:hypothetical protein
MCAAFMGLTSKRDNTVTGTLTARARRIQQFPVDQLEADK